MNIDEYRNLCHEHLAAPLGKVGFKAVDDHLHYVEGETELALLRIKDKWSHLTQKVRYLVVVRHSFLPDLENREIEGFVSAPSLYPFKSNPGKLKSLYKGVFRKTIRYKYQSINLGHYDTLDLDYGEGIDVSVLSRLADDLGSAGVEWMRGLPPINAANQIRKFGNDEYVEKIWLRAYRARGF